MLFVVRRAKTCTGVQAVVPSHAPDSTLCHSMQSKKKAGLVWGHVVDVSRRRGLCSPGRPAAPSVLGRCWPVLRWPVLTTMHSSFRVGGRAGFVEGGVLLIGARAEKRTRRLRERAESSLCVERKPTLCMYVFTLRDGRNQMEDVFPFRSFNGFLASNPVCSGCVLWGSSEP